MEYCKVQNCRYSEYHATQRHRCGTCKQLGHGQMECNNMDLKYNLKQYIDRVNTPCTSIDCVDNTTHTTEGHDCLYCKLRVGHLKHCPSITKKYCDSLDSIDICDTLKDTMQNYMLRGGHYITKYAGQGCIWYVRCTKGGIYEYLFMHGDSWGQYGPNSDESPRYTAFVRDYVLQEELN
jgi:hypothetical protein